MASDREVGTVGEDQHRVGLDFAPAMRGQERRKAVRFPGDHEGEALATVWLGEPDFDFHAELPGESLQARLQGGGMAIACKPRGLQRHAELAAGDLLLERLDVGLLFEQKGGDARDDAGLVTPDDSDGGKLPHFWSRQTLWVFWAKTQLFFTVIVDITK